MKRWIPLLVLLLMYNTSALYADMTADAPDGQSLFAENGCTTCHDSHMEGIGPSLQTIKMQYNMDEEALFRYLKSDAPARIAPQQASVMQAQLAKIGTLYDDEIRALTRYILGMDDF